MHSRRDILKALLLSSAGLAGCGSSSNSSDAGGSVIGPAPPRDNVDVVVIGAGVAGLVAAQTVLAGGRSVAVLEARNRAGGRTLTDNSTFSPFPIDLGAQFFHQSEDNPLLLDAIAQGIPLLPDFGKRSAILNGAPAPEELLAQFFLTAAAFEAAYLAAGAAAQLGGPDLAVGDATADLRDEPYYYLATASISNGRTGTLIETPTSSLDLTNFTDLSPLLLAGVGDDIFIPSGMGNFILATYSPGVPISLRTPVTEIRWGDSSGVRVVSSQGTLTARTAIVTIPTSVLATGQPRFSPALPAAYQGAFAGLPLGAVGKVVLQFAPGTFPEPANTFAVQLENTQEVTPTVINQFNANTTVSFLDGPVMREIERQGAPFAVDYMLTALTDMFGPQVRRNYTGRNLITNWISDPYSQGAYSYAIPGQVPARAQLAVPVANQLWFAGEAVSLQSHGSINAAYLSAKAAAAGALAALSV